MARESLTTEDQGQRNSSLNKLNIAAANLNDGMIGPAINQIEAFVNQVQGLIGGGVLTPGQGQPLIDMAEDVISPLGG